MGNNAKIEAVEAVQASGTAEVNIASVDFAPDREAIDSAVFTANLDTFKRLTVDGMASARVCAEMALTHFAKTGDVVYLQNMLDVIEKEGKNYVRKAAFLSWAVAFSPLTSEKGKLRKDKSKDANPFNLLKAEEKPFWEFAPEKEAVVFGYNDVVVKLKAVVKSFEDEKKFKAGSAKALEAVAATKEFVAKLA